MNQAKPADIRKHVVYGMWATNKYWAATAERVASLLQQYNLSAEHPGTFDIDRPATELPPRDLKDRLHCDRSGDGSCHCSLFCSCSCAGCHCT